MWRCSGKQVVGNRGGGREYTQNSPQPPQIPSKVMCLPRANRGRNLRGSNLAMVEDGEWRAGYGRTLWEGADGGVMCWGGGWLHFIPGVIPFPGDRGPDPEQGKAGKLGLVGPHRTYWVSEDEGKYKGRLEVFAARRSTHVGKNTHTVKYY